MLRGRRMLFNTMLLTATSLLMRTIGMVFQVYLSKKIGASGIGLFQLIMSVSALASTFAISGIRFAATRIISEELGRQNEGGVKPAVLRCTVYALVFGFGAMAILFTSSEFVGTKCIGDIRTVLSLRLLSLSLPCLALSAVFGGYFTAVCRVVKSSVVAVAEQIIRITVTRSPWPSSAGWRTTSRGGTSPSTPWPTTRSAGWWMPSADSRTWLTG